MSCAQISFTLRVSGSQLFIVPDGGKGFFGKEFRYFLIINYNNCL